MPNTALFTDQDLSAGRSLSSSPELFETDAYRIGWYKLGVAIFFVVVAVLVFRALG